jgi:hypothetical protein
MSATRSLLIAALFGLGFATPALARDPVFTIRLEAPAAQSRVIALNTLWNCEGQTCQARPNHAATVRSCRRFVAESGARVLAYGPEGGELSADELARCNGEGQATQQARN